MAWWGRGRERGPAGGRDQGPAAFGWRGLGGLRENTFLNRLLSQGVQTLALGLGCHRQLFVELGRNAKLELARKLLAGLNAFLLADFQKDIQGLLEFCAQLLWIGTIEISAATQAKNLSAKQIGLRVLFNPGAVAVDGHHVHDVTPCSSNHLRIEATAPLSVFGEG